MKKARNGKMPGDVLDPCWVYQHTKGHVLIPSHLVEISVRLLECHLMCPRQYNISHKDRKRKNNPGGVNCLSWNAVLELFSTPRFPHVSFERNPSKNEVDPRKSLLWLVIAGSTEYNIKMQLRSMPHVLVLNLDPLTPTMTRWRPNYPQSLFLLPSIQSGISFRHLPKVSSTTDRTF